MSEEMTQDSVQESQEIKTESKPESADSGLLQEVMAKKATIKELQAKLGEYETANEKARQKQLSEDGTMEVQKDFELVCWDFVSNPSTHGAFMAPISEGVIRKRKTSKYDKVNTIINEILCDLTCKCSLPTRRK